MTWSPVDDRLGRGYARDLTETGQGVEFTEKTDHWPGLAPAGGEGRIKSGQPLFDGEPFLREQ